MLQARLCVFAIFAPLRELLKAKGEHEAIIWEH